MLIHVQVACLGIIVFTVQISILASQCGSTVVGLPKFMEETKSALKTLDNRVDIMNERLDTLNGRFGSFKEMANLRFDAIVYLLDNMYVFFFTHNLLVSFSHHMESFYLLV
jgi:hypothetical protein